jgi:cytochrome c biogenesis protein CcmG, thiol:disulfide interchange protein DsbE
MSAAGATARHARPGADRLQTIVVVAVTVIVIGAAAWFVAGRGGDDGVTAVNLTGDVADAAPAVGASAPDFVAQTYDGQTVALSDYAGKPVWLTFGASWCPDCRTEAPDVEAAYQSYKGQGLVVLGVFIDEGADDIRSYAQRAGLTFPIAVDQNELVASAYRTMGIPTHFFIGADGRIREVRVGALPKSEMERAISEILN